MRKKYPTRSLTEVPGWIKLTCQRCSGEFWSVPAQAIHTKFCSTTCNDEPPEIRFWKSVTKDGPMHPAQPELGCCWICHFTPSAPYPWLKINGKPVKASRFSLALHLGRPVSETLNALHSCDNTKCVNPIHLREGTQQDNIDECIKRGRKAVGFQFGHTEVTLEKVKEIKAAKDTMLLREAALKFGMGISSISKIWRGERWGNI